MGHKVSKPRYDIGYSAAGTATTSLAILLALVASSSADSYRPSTSSSCCSCFVSRPQSLNPWELPTSTTTTLHASSSTILSAKTVPPPNSRLGRLQQASSISQASTRAQRQPPGTKRSQRAVNSRGSGGKDKHRQTDLRYATHYSEDTHIFSNGEEDEDSLAITRATTAQRMNRKTSAATYKRGKKAKMIRFLDRRLARLHLTPSNYTNSNPNFNKNNQRRLDYEQQKAAWAAKYTSVKRLRKSFGSNKNRLWGDFDPTSTRRLYHTLLPRALLELKGLRDGLLSTKDDVEGKNVTIEGEQDRRKVKSNNRLPWSSKDDESNNIDDSEENNYLQQELKELAPLAYQARLAAKKYARERSRLPGRIGSMLYDGYRSWRRYGKWKSTGMTWEQVWNKYEDQVLQEAMGELENGAAVDDEAKNAIFNSSTSEEKIEGVANSVTRGEDIDDEELTARICLRILERSVVTNGAIDKLFLKELAKEDGEEDEKEMIERGSNKSVARKRRRVRRRRLRRREKRIQADLQAIEMKFDDDIRELLKYSTLATQEGEDRRNKRKRGAFFWKSNKSSDLTDKEKREEEGVEISASVDKSASTATADTSESVEQLAADMLSENEEVSSPVDNDTSDNSNRDVNKLRKLAIHEVFALRLLATTKQRLSLLQALPSLGEEGGVVEDDNPSSDSEDDTSN